MTRKRETSRDAHRDAARDIFRPAAESARAPNLDRAAGGVKEGKTAGGLVRVSAYVSKDHADELARLAAIDGLSVSALVKTAVRRYIEERRAGRA